MESNFNFTTALISKGYILKNPKKCFVLLNPLEGKFSQEFIEYTLSSKYKDSNSKIPLSQWF